MSIISTWAPARQTIVGFTFSNPGIVTTQEPHGYYSGLYVRLTIPVIQLITNNRIFLITVLSPTTFSLNVDTTNFEIPMSFAGQSPQVIPVGEISEILDNAERNTLTPIGG